MGDNSRAVVTVFVPSTGHIFKTKKKTGLRNLLREKCIPPLNPKESTKKRGSSRLTADDIRKKTCTGEGKGRAEKKGSTH